MATICRHIYFKRHDGSEEGFFLGSHPLHPLASKDEQEEEEQEEEEEEEEKEEEEEEEEKEEEEELAGAVLSLSEKGNHDL